MVKNLILKVLKPFANMGKLSFDKRPNFAMRLFIFINTGMHIFFIPALGRICSAPSLDKAKTKFHKHEIVELPKIDVVKYLVKGDSFKDELVERVGRVQIQNRIGYGEDSMKITFSMTGTRIKLNTNVVPKEVISKLLEIIKPQQVTQTMRSNYIGISSVLKPTYVVKLFSAKKKTHIANYNATKNTIELVKSNG